MSAEQKESRIHIENLPQSEQELTPEEAKEVQGGVGAALHLKPGFPGQAPAPSHSVGGVALPFNPYGNFQGGVRVAVGDVDNDGG